MNVYRFKINLPSDKPLCTWHGALTGHRGQESGSNFSWWMPPSLICWNNLNLRLWLGQRFRNFLPLTFPWIQIFARSQFPRKFNVQTIARLIFQVNSSTKLSYKFLDSLWQIWSISLTTKGAVLHHYRPFSQPASTPFAFGFCDAVRVCACCVRRFWSQVASFYRSRTTTSPNHDFFGIPVIHKFIIYSVNLPPFVM